MLVFLEIIFNKPQSFFLEFNLHTTHRIEIVERGSVDAVNKSVTFGLDGDQELLKLVFSKHERLPNLKHVIQRFD